MLHAADDVLGLAVYRDTSAHMAYGLVRQQRLKEVSKVSQIINKERN